MIKDATAGAITVTSVGLVAYSTIIRWDAGLIVGAMLLAICLFAAYDS